jgi:hypothetical protein
MAIRIQMRRDTEANWIANNPILKPGEIGLALDKFRFKAGYSETSRWNDCVYLNVYPGELVEAVQDAIGTSVNHSDHSHITVTYNDATNKFVFGTAPEVVLSSGLTDTLGDYVEFSYFQGILDEPNGIPTLDSNGLIMDAEIPATIARVASPTFTGTVGGITKAMVGLSNVDNTTDALKPISTATQTALDLKAPKANPTFTGTVSTSNLTVSGNLTVTGETTSQSTQNLSVANPLIYVGENNQANIIDIGIVGSFNNGTYQHSGLARDHVANKWKLFKGVISEPTTVINFAQGSLDDLAVGGLTATTISGTTSITSPSITASTKVTTNDLEVTGTLTLPEHAISSGSLDWEHYAQEVDLPSAAFKHGMFAHVHGTGSAYYAHSGEWRKIAKVTDISDNNLTTISQQTASYTPGLADAFKMIEMTTGTLSLPNDSAVNFPIGTTIDVLQTTTSQITINGTGFTPDATPGLKLRTRWSSATCLKRGANSWVVFGDLSA